MLKILSIILILALIITMVGCSVVVDDDDEEEVSEREHGRFLIIEHNTHRRDLHYDIVVDKETHIVYIFMKNGTGTATYAGLTPLLDENGEPMKWEDYR